MPNPLLVDQSEKLIFSYYNENYFRIWRNYVIRSLEWLVTAILDLIYFVIDLATLLQIPNPSKYFPLRLTGSDVLPIGQITLEEYYASIESPLYVVTELVDLVYLINLPSAAIVCLMFLHYFEHYRPFTITSVRLYFWNCMFILGANLALIPVSYFFPRGYCYCMASYIILKAVTVCLILWLFWGFPILFVYHYVRIQKHSEIAARSEELPQWSRFRILLREDEQFEYQKVQPPVVLPDPQKHTETKKYLKQNRWGSDRL